MGCVDVYEDEFCANGRCSGEDVEVTSTSALGREFIPARKIWSYNTIL